MATALIAILAIAVSVPSFVCAREESSTSNPAKCAGLKGLYFGQAPPGLQPEFFADGCINTTMGMHGNIVFSPDLTSAVWHPDEPMGLYSSEQEDGTWSDPVEISFVDEQMHDAPCFSHDGKTLYFISGPLGQSGKTEQERFYRVNRINDGWSEPQLLSTSLNAFDVHWQFSVDRDGNLYFGGKRPGVDDKADIYFAPKDGDGYAEPIRLPESINTDGGEFSPCISPDHSYLIFNRITTAPQSRPKCELFVSFKDDNGEWADAISMSDVLQSRGWDLNCRISPDGKYLFFMSMRDGRNGTFWVDASVLNQLR